MDASLLSGLPLNPLPPVEFSIRLWLWWSQVLLIMPLFLF